MSSNSASSENINSEKPSSDESDEPKNNDEVPLAAQDEGVLEAYLDVLLKDDVTQPSLDVGALPQRASEGERSRLFAGVLVQLRVLLDRSGALASAASLTA